MQHWQLPFLGLQVFPTELTAFEIRYFFTFTTTEREAIFSRYGEHHRLAAAIQIGWIKMTGCPLDAFDTLPIAVLRHLGTELALATPELTSLRALYGRRSTLYEHQAWAAELLGFRPFTERRQRALARQVRREAHKAITLNRLVEFARRWLYEQNLENLRRNHYAPIRRVSPCVTYKTNVMRPKEPSDASPQKPLSRSCAHDLRHHAQADQGSACLSPCPGRPCGGRGAPCLRRLRHLPRGEFCPA